jgi:hypothetical protein
VEEGSGEGRLKVSSAALVLISVGSLAELSRNCPVSVSEK